MIMGTGTLIILGKTFVNDDHIGYSCNNVQFFDKLELELFDVEDGLRVVAVSSRYLNYFRDVFPKSAVSWTGSPGQEVR
jgi:hypothetical protein